MPEEGFRLLRGRVTGCCEPSDVEVKLRSSGNGKCLPLLFSHSGSLCFFLYSQDPMLSQASPDTSEKGLGRNCLAQFFFKSAYCFPCSGALVGTIAVYKGWGHSLDDRQQLEGVGYCSQVPIQ